MFATDMTTLLEWGDTIIRINLWLIIWLMIALIIWVAARSD